MMEMLPKILIMTVFFWLLAGFSGVYLGICLLLYFGQRRIIFEPHFQLPNPIPADYPLAFDQVSIPTVNDQMLVGWWFPSDAPQGKAVLFLHGNAGVDDFNFHAIKVLHRFGFSVLLFNYRGYGASPKIFPNEQRVYEDARAGYDFLCGNYGVLPENLLVYGHSLGGAIAIELATCRKVAGLFLESTFTSMLEMSTTKPIYRIFPINKLLHQRFDSRKKIVQLHIPLFFCHGTLDETIPSFMSERLWAIANEPKRLEIIKNADHHNLAEVGKDQITQGIEWLNTQTIHQA